MARVHAGCIYAGASEAADKMPTVPHHALVNGMGEKQHYCSLERIARFVLLANA